MQPAATARTDLDFRLDDDVLAGQMPGEAADIAHRLGPGRPAWRVWFSHVRVGLDRRRREVLEPQSQLTRILAPNRSDRAPYSARRNVSSIARNLPFSLRSSTMISISVSGSRGKGRRRTPCPERTELSQRFASFSALPPRFFQLAPERHRAGSNPSR